MRALVALLVLAMFAGCADETGSEPEPEFNDDAFGELEATEDTGIIRGVVIDAAITPIEGALIQVTGTELEATSGASGAFGFSKLEPGTYFLKVSRVGFLSVQSSVEVVAGVAEPPVVKVLLERDASFSPYATLHHHRGYYQCGLAFVVVCGAPNVLLGDGTAPDSSTWTFLFDPGASHIQSEMNWETTQSVSPDLRMEVETLDAGCSGGTLIGNTLGPSPLRMITNETHVQERGIGGEECGLYHSVFAGDILEQQHCFAWGPVPLVKCGVGFSIEQDFEWFITEFHGYTPPEDWWFIHDGPLPPPS